MGKGLEAGLSLARSRAVRTPGSPLRLECQEGREGWWESSQSDTVSVHLLIICPLPQEWNLLKNKRLVCHLHTCILSAGFLLDAQ